MNIATLVKTSWSRLSEIATCAETSPEQLTQIAEQVIQWRPTPEPRWDRLGALIARHPNTPPKTLARLAGRFPRAFLANPILPLLLLEEPGFIARFQESDLLRILRFPQAPLCFITACHTHPNAQVAEAVRGHVAIAGEISPEGEVWQHEVVDAVMRLPVPDPESLFNLVETESAPCAFLERIGLAAVHEPELPPEARRVRKRLRGWARRRAMQRARRAAGTAPSVDEPKDGWSHLVGHTVQHRDYSTLLDMALDPDLPAEAMPVLATTRSIPYHIRRRLRLHLARNLDTPSDVLTQILLSYTAPRIAAHPNATPAMIQTVAENYRRLDTLLETAYSRKATAELLDRILAQRQGGYLINRNAHLRRLVRWHPNYAGREGDASLENAPTRILEGYAWTTGLVRFILAATNPLTPELLRREADSDSWYRRLAAALNSRTPAKCRQMLAEDSHRLVRAAACARLTDSARPLSILGL
jgi:hypothetical protein